MKKFALIGASGYIAPRHLKAIKETGNELLVAMDINDSVGIMDSYFPKAEFFTEFEEFEAFVEDQELKGNKLDFVSICSPNYLHAPHMKFALKRGINVICEKPLVLSSEELKELELYQNRYRAKVNTILQLRLHPSINALRKKVAEARPEKIFDVTLTYLTSRGNWYAKSWKGLDHKSGGLATNIGIHFFDMLHYIFGRAVKNEIYHRDAKTTAGYLEYERARIRWFLSIDPNHLPDTAIHGEKSTYRSILIDNEELEFSTGFTDLHTQSYQRIIEGKGYGIEENEAAIKTAETIRKSIIKNSPSNHHPYLSKVLI